ncbi:MAG: bifunctional adenosylcobinamide kinase/adenosylcobinamide-phosphate guanylyltransferase [Lachnospiraceae bacterium]|jgi:adenosylcobinamide kinase/adenosylcobinamide-phosphate guanylyltransferase|nr:bifunctional adenosylcobinamide kinase/adenosylcobinamide-phosphate guanylyltransferase [Lachnospiraceae bacterium]
MFELIIGGSGSGKSEYAENLAMNLAREEYLPLYYIATMLPYGEEGKKRIERHQKLRAGKGFYTIECYVNLRRLVLPARGIVLLECLSNLTANEMFEDDGAKEQTTEAVLSGVSKVREGSRHLVVVTNDIFSDGITYDETTVRYQKYLGEANQRLAAMADQVTEVVCGIPLQLKNTLQKTEMRDKCESVVEQL